jgi:hypothetical protein
MEWSLRLEEDGVILTVIGWTYLFPFQSLRKQERVCDCLLIIEEMGQALRSGYIPLVTFVKLSM